MYPGWSARKVASMDVAKSANSQKIVEFLLRLAPHASISDHVPGKIKLKVELSGLLLMGDYDLGSMVRSIPGILKTDAQLLSRSVVITYDPRKLPYELWEALVQIKRDPAHAPRVRAILEKVLQQQRA